MSLDLLLLTADPSRSGLFYATLVAGALVGLPRDHRLAGRRRIPLSALADDTWMAPSRDS